MENDQPHDNPELAATVAGVPVVTALLGKGILVREDGGNGCVEFRPTS